MLLSGGIDSATCAYLAKGRYRLRALTFEYRGIVRGEIVAARGVAHSAGVAAHSFFRLPDLREAGDIPGFNRGEMPPTYIPMRNGIFYSVAASVAEEVGADAIIGGHNKDDARTFVDAGPDFFNQLQRSMWAGSRFLRSKRIKILRPLGGRTKVQVIRLAESLGVPFEETWSCHRQGKTHCWKCDGCLARIWAFIEAGVADPLRETRG
ncbi:MAG: 7-cyano-7-deazaguanine synthase [Thaumarchaeota archaeon]|nr:7-cyano-7-deazaguanine synthase [Nitrososphaerota archaeon]